jgi:hypothetical protein
MRTIIIMATLCLFTSLSFAQHPVLNEFYQKYTSYENVTDVKLQGWLLQLASEFSDEEQANKLLEKITHLRVLVMEEGNLVSPKDYSRLKTHIRKDAFEELFMVKEGQDDIGLYIREEGQSITDVLLLINGEDNFVLLSLEGLFKFSDLNDLRIDVEGIEHLERLPDDKKSVPRA